MFANLQQSNNIHNICVSTEKELYESLASNTTIYVTKSLSITRKFTKKGIRNLSVIGTKDIIITVNKGMTLKFVNGENILIKNLMFVGDLQDNKNGEISLQFVGCKNCIIDYCSFSNGEDEQLCIKGDSDNFTVSHCKFEHNSIGGHAYSVLVGRSGSDKPTSGAYHVTFYQCYFNGGSGRNPRFRNAIIHLINCYWGSGVLGYLIGPENSDVFLDSCVIEKHMHCKVINEYGKFRIRYENTKMWEGENKHFIPESDVEVALPDYDYECIDVIDLPKGIHEVSGNILSIDPVRLL